MPIGRENLNKIIRYGVSGVITAAVNILTYYFLVAIGVEYSFANIVAVVSSIICAYIINKTYVFGVKSKTKQAMFKEAIRFMTARGTTGVIDYVGLIFCVEICRMDEVFAKVIVVTLVIILNYVWSKQFVFKREQ